MRAKTPPYERAGRLLVGSILLALWGCGAPEPALIPVHGRLLHQGKPVGGAELVFHPQSGEVPWMPVARTQEDGTFEASTKRPGDGVVAGRYRVTVVCHPDATDDNPGRNMVPERFAQVATTPLEIVAQTDREHYHAIELQEFLR